MTVEAFAFEQYLLGGLIPRPHEDQDLAAS